MKKNIIEVISIVLAFIMVLVPKYIAPICPVKDDGSHMGCYYSANLTTKISIVVIAILIITIIFSNTSFNKVFKIIGNIVNVILVFFIYAIPHKIIHIHNETGKVYGFCKSETMPCVHNHTFEILGYISFVIGILMILNLIKTFLTKNNR